MVLTSIGLLYKVELELGEGHYMVTLLFDQDVQFSVCCNEASVDFNISSECFYYILS